MNRKKLCIKAVEVRGIADLVEDTVDIRHDGIDYYSVPVRIFTDRDCRKKMKQGTFDWGIHNKTFGGGAFHFVWPENLGIETWRKYSTDFYEEENCLTVTPEAWAIAEYGADQYNNVAILGFIAVIGVKEHGSAWRSHYCYAGTDYETWEGYIAAYPDPDGYPPNYRFYAAPTYWPYVEIYHHVDSFGKITVYDLIRDQIAMIPVSDYSSLFLGYAQSSPSDFAALWLENGLVGAITTVDDQEGDILGNTFLKPHISTAGLYSYYNTLAEPKSMRPVMVPYGYKTDILLDQYY